MKHRRERDKGRMWKVTKRHTRMINLFTLIPQTAVLLFLVVERLRKKSVEKFPMQRQSLSPQLHGHRVNLWRNPKLNGPPVSITPANLLVIVFH